MAIDKVKLPDNSVEEVRDSRIPGIDSAPTTNSANLVTSGGVKSALSGYLALTGGTMSNTNLVTNLNADLLDGKHNGDLYANGLRYYGHSTMATRLTAGDTLSFDADAGMHYYLISGQMTDGGRPNHDGYGVQMEWDNSSWRTQLWVNNSDDSSATLGHMKIRHQNNVATWGDWHTFAMLDSNVASATKLQTARSIWGQSFDGTDDVTGHIYLTGANVSSSTANTSQIVFGTPSYNHVVLTSNANALIINPTTASTSGQTVIGCNGVGTQFKTGTFSVSGAATFGSSLTAKSLTTTLKTSQPSGGMLPNMQYALGELSGDTTFSMAAGTSGVTNHYYWTFSTPSTAPTITWPAAITSWFGGSATTINANKHYEVSVLDGVAICMEV